MNNADPCTFNSRKTQGWGYIGFLYLVSERLVVFLTLFVFVDILFCFFLNCRHILLQHELLPPFLDGMKHRE